MEYNILILGPISVGKTSVSKELARRMGKKLIEMDKERKHLYSEIGFSIDECEKEYKVNGIMGWYKYQKPFELYSVKRLLEENNNSIIDFGGGQSVYHEASQIEEFLKLVKQEPYIFLLIPYPDIEESLKLLNSRTSHDEEEMNRMFISSESSRKSAKYIIYTKTKSVNEIADEILRYIR